MKLFLGFIRVISWYNCISGPNIKAKPLILTKKTSNKSQHIILNQNKTQGPGNFQNIHKSLSSADNIKFKLIFTNTKLC